MATGAIMTKTRPPGGHPELPLLPFLDISKFSRKVARRRTRKNVVRRGISGCPKMIGNS